MNESSSSSSVSSASSASSIIEYILTSCSDPEINSYECILLPVRIYEPSEIRKAFYKLSLKVHPDKNPTPPHLNNQSKEAFQKLSTAFEILYDTQSQKQHYHEIQIEIQEKQRQQEEGKNKKRKQHPPTSNNDWKERAKAKKKQKKEENEQRKKYKYRAWEDFVKDLKHREELEKKFIRGKSDERLEKRVKGMIWKAMKICRTLDERAGCPSTFVNGLWAPLYEQEVWQTYKNSLPDGYEYRWDTTDKLLIDERLPAKRIYRHIQTGTESDIYPNPQVQELFQKAKNAELTNKYRFYTQPRLFLNEIIEYLKEDHDYIDMDDDMIELQQDEQARDDQQQSKEYDY